MSAPLSARARHLFAAAVGPFVLQAILVLVEGTFRSSIPSFGLCSTLFCAVAGSVFLVIEFGLLAAVFVLVYVPVMYYVLFLFSVTLFGVVFGVFP